MKLIPNDLDNAAQQGIITPEQAKKLWQYLEALRPDQARFQALHVLYYFGGVLILASMSWFLTNVWESGWAVMGIAGLFATLYAIVGHGLWAKQNLKIPGGLLITAAVGLTPVFVYGLQKGLGLWPQGDPGAYKNYHIWVKGSWFFMEIATIIAAAVALRIYQFSFLTFPLALSLWYMSMDLTPLLFGKDDFTFDERKIVSCIFGLLMLAVAYTLDLRNKKIDFAFWTYLFGTLAFWGGLSMMNSDSELSKFLYCLINVGFVILSVYLRRKVFIVFGTLGILGYIGHLAWEIFKDSFAFPIALALLGIFILFLGVKYQKNRSRFESAVERHLPSFLMKWRPPERT